MSSPTLVWLERHQIALYLASIAVGAGVGFTAPSTVPLLELSITPALALLLFATFLSVPLTQVGRAFLDVRFLATVLIVNFVAVPIVVFGLSRFVIGNDALLLGTLLVLLTPCIDYVIVFTGLAGGSRERLLAATPMLMLLQLLLLPAYLWLIAGPNTVKLVESGPFAQAFLYLIVVPLLAAALVQWIAKKQPLARSIESVTAAAMVPLVMAVLAVVVGSQIAAVSNQLGQLGAVIPLFVGFAALMLIVGLAAGRIAKLDVTGNRAVVFSGVTRNSLVVLPLALALPDAFALTPLVVVTQTLIELIIMVIFVRLIPKLLPAH